MEDLPYRSPERVRFHYEVECELADRLRRASKAERRTLYSSVYDELFRRVEDHPQLTIKNSEEDRRQRVVDRMATVRRLLRPGMRFIEIGPGDCAFSFAVAPLVGEVIAIDVSDEITRATQVPANFRLALSDGTNVPVEPGSVDIAYSDQLMEHLHPDDAHEQLTNIAKSLKPGGLYFCRTPNRLSGPHDVSGKFDEVARGLHLREYTLAELSQQFAALGMSKQSVLVGGLGHYVEWPLWPVLAFERFLKLLPRRLAKAIAASNPGRALLGVRLLARKA